MLRAASQTPEREPKWFFSETLFEFVQSGNTIGFEKRRAIN